MTRQSRIWRPILSGALREDVTAATDALAEDLSEYVGREELHQSSLSGGDAGIALFFNYLDRISPDNVHRGTAEKLLDRAVDSIAGEPLWFSFYVGVTGVAWACQHAFEISADDDALDEVDDGLAELLDTENWPGLYELINGLAGHGMYALERWPRGRSGEILEKVSGHLLNMAETADEGVAWRTQQQPDPLSERDELVGGEFNCGVSHGMPAVLGILAACARLDINREPALEAVRGGVRWLLAQQSDADDRPRFPATVVPSGEASRSRLAWCYGDLGIAGLLTQVAHLLEDRELADRAVMIGLHAASIPDENDGIMDTPLCHGTAGVAHVFNRLYQSTGNARFQEAATRWFERLLAMRDPERGIGGFLRHHYEYGYIPEAGLLEGSAGIGLAMLGAIGDVEPAWDRFLAMSFPV